MSHFLVALLIAKAYHAAMEKEVRAKRTMDMLSGSLFDKLLIFAIPLALSSILQQLFTSVDVAVVGHFAENPAVATAAVGCNGPVINLIINLFVGISIGANVVISNYIGEGSREKIGSAVHSAMSIAIISGVFILVLGLAVAEPVLSMMNTPESVKHYAVEYLRIYSLGMPFVMVYNFGAAILRSIGDTKRPLICLVLSGVLNALLNLFLVIVFHLDVADVAIATVISNGVSASMIFVFLMREKNEIRLDIKRLGISRQVALRMMKIGIPAGLQSMVFSLSNVIIQSVLNGFGTAAVAGSAVSLNYENFSYFIISAFTQTAVTFTSQNFGARNYERCKRVFRLCMVSAIVLTGMMSWTFILGRDFFISIFNSNPEVARYAAIRLMMILSLNILSNTYEIGGASLRGIGYSMTPAILTVFGTCVFRLFWAYTICRMYPSFDVLIAVYPISWVLTGSAVLIAYFVIRKKVFSAPRRLV